MRLELIEDMWGKHVKLASAVSQDYFLIIIQIVLHTKFSQTY